MSYSCKISFKQLEPKDIYNFLKMFKTNILNNLQEISTHEAIYSPMCRQYNSSYTKLNREQKKICQDWAKNVFTYRWFYLSDYNILGVYGVPNCMDKNFDNNTWFQNSCDQDYEFETWNGITLFEQIANKWSNCTPNFVLGDTDMYTLQELQDEETFEYAIKSCCYTQIWSLLEDTLYNDKESVYLSLFNYYDLYEIEKFLVFCDNYLLKEGFVEK